MKQTVTEASFISQFQSISPGHFSLSALIALFEWIEKMYEYHDSGYELNVVALARGWTEYSSVMDCISEHGFDFDVSNTSDPEEQEEAAFELLRHRAMVIVFEGGIIVSAF